jgi:hypothetical protein
LKEKKGALENPATVVGQVKPASGPVPQLTVAVCTVAAVPAHVAAAIVAASPVVEFCTDAVTP